jgi:PPOX class probable F420-dependent enzyme
VTIPDSARRLLDSAPHAHVVTLDPDGAPQASLAWVGVEGDELVLATLSDQRKLRNLRRDPRIVLSFEGPGSNPIGLREYLVISGRARVTEGGAPELLQRLAHRYLGPEVVFPPMPNPPAGYVTRVTVDRIGGIGPWSERG